MPSGLQSQLQDFIAKSVAFGFKVEVLRRRADNFQLCVWRQLFFRKKSHPNPLCAEIHDNPLY